MISLREALKLTKPTDFIWLRKAGTTEYNFWNPHLMTLKKVRETLDMRAVMVHEIRPYFIGGDFDGFEYIVTGPGIDRMENDL